MLIRRYCVDRKCLDDGHTASGHLQEMFRRNETVIVVCDEVTGLLDAESRRGTTQLTLRSFLCLQNLSFLVNVVRASFDLFEKFYNAENSKRVRSGLPFGDIKNFSKKPHKAEKGRGKSHRAKNKLESRDHSALEGLYFFLQGLDALKLY